MPSSIRSVRGRQAALQARKRGRERFPPGKHSLFAGGKVVGGWWRTEDVGHVGLVEKGQEHADAFNDGRPELDVEIAPIFRVPALDSIQAVAQLVAGALARLKFPGNFKLHELVLKLLGPGGGREITNGLPVPLAQLARVLHQGSAGDADLGGASGFGIGAGFLDLLRE